MKKAIGGAVLVLVLLAAQAWPALAKAITITILHTNDMHAHVEEFTQHGHEMGGYARQETLINRFRASDPNPILLSAGDTFQGTLYFNVYHGLADLAFMNVAGYQAMAVGNHEFDRGSAVLARFASLARFPLLAANLDVSGDKELATLIKPYTVLEVGGERIGIVGAITPELLTISTPGPDVKLKDLVSSVQAAVDELTRTGVDKIILLSHIGYDADKELAPKLRGVDVIVGGHSHTLLGTVPGLPQPAGPYPTVLKDVDGNTVLIVQAWDWGRVLGRIEVSFDDAGRVASWADALPVPIVPAVSEDATVKSMVAAFSLPLAAARDEIVGHTVTGVARTRVTPRHADNPMADVITDAMLAATEKAGSVAAFVNSGGVRAGLDPGPITYGQAVTVQPFNNTLVQLDLSGAELKAVLEETLGGMPGNASGLLYPSRGTSYVIDIGKPAGERVEDLEVGGKPVQAGATYRITLPSFIAGGGDSHPLAKNAKGYRYDTGVLDIDAFVDYLKAHDPIDGRLEGRITIVGTPEITRRKP
jgi:5'-nucleotidase